jgi:MYXO-CTERM domain-containing protein
MKAKLLADFRQPVLDAVEVRVARTPEEMARLAPPEVPPPAYASGVAYPSMRLVLLTMTAPATSEGVDLDEVFRHELAHIALRDAVGATHVPLWFNEGVAVHASGEHPWMRVQALWNAAVSDTLLPLADVDAAFPEGRYEVSVAYAQAADLVRFLRRDADRERFATLLARMRKGQPFASALTDAYGTDLRTLEYQWHEDVKRRFSVVPMITGGSILWVAALAILVAAFVKRRRRSKAILARWAAEEAAEDARRQRMHEWLAQSEEGPRVPPSQRVPVVVHDGRPHVLH